MAFTKITNQELNSRGATTLPNQPKISATALKQEFDAPAKNIVAPKFNNLIDELEATTGAASLGIVTPTGRTGETVQAVIDDISDDLATLEGSVGPAIEDAHTHANKDLLDTYTQTESDLANAVSNAHTHSNKTVIDKFSDVSGVPYYNGAPIAGSGEMAIDGSNAAPVVNFTGSFTVGTRQTIGATVGASSTSEGRMNLASGDYSHAEGNSCDATGENAHVEGFSSTASGDTSHAEGVNTTASEAAAHAEGNGSTSSGLYSHAEGGSTTASARAAHAEGGYTTASDEYAHAEGYHTTASAKYTHAGGYYTNAAYDYQTAIGKYNLNRSNTIFEVGNGTGTNAKSNAFEVYANGDVNIKGNIMRDGAVEYLENSSVTLSTSTTTDVTFTNGSITSGVAIDCYCTQYGLNPDNIQVDGVTHTCVVTMPKVDTAVTVGVRIYLK